MSSEVTQLAPGVPQSELTFQDVLKPSTAPYHRGGGALPTRKAGSGWISLQRRVCGRHSGDRHPEGRAADVVETRLVEKDDRGRISAVLAADADLQVGAGLAALLHAQANQLADAPGVEGLEGIGRDEPALDIAWQEAGRVTRLRPKVVWVRSLEPKEKNSASVAISPAVSAARGSSIMVPTV